MNTYKVPKKKWSKWSALARSVFNSVYGAMQTCPEMYWHPHQGKISARYWRTTSWNAAWIAADATMGR